MRIPFFAKKEEIANIIPQGRAEVSLRDPLLYPRGSGWAPYNPDIFVMRKGGLDVYDKMRRDEQIKVCQWIKRLAVLCSGWNVEPASDDNADKEIADFCIDVLKRLKGTLEERIKEILSGMDYGFSVTEKIWEIIGDGDFKGKVGLKALKTRKPHSWDFDTDEYGNLRPQGLWQLNGAYKYEPQKFIIYSHNKEFDNWYGTSDLQAVYRSWWAKDIVIRFWNIFLEKFGMGIPVLKPDSESGTISDPIYTELKNAIFNLQNSSALAWNTPGISVDVLESKRRGADEYDRAINYYDQSIAKGLLMPSGIGFSQDTTGQGSYARSQTHFDVWVWIMMDLRGTVEESIMNEQIVKEMVDYNFNAIKYPKFVFNPLEEGETIELGKLWTLAVQGKVVHPDAEDENHFRSLLKFPERDRDELEAAIEEEKASKPAFFPGGGFQPNNPDEGNNQPIDKQTKLQSKKDYWFRKLTKYERRVDFQGVKSSLDDLEEQARTDLTDIFKKQQEKVLANIERNADKINQTFINTFSIPYSVEFRSTLKEFLRTTYELGRRDALEEIGKAKGQGFSKYLLKIPPTQVIDMLEKQSFWIKNVLFDGLTKKIQGLLINMIETGEVPGETLMKIRKVYDPYVGDEGIVADQRQIEPYRIETVIRTNATKAYNKGRMGEFRDPDLDGYVKAMQLSAILDDRTTDICREADGKIVLLDDPNADRLTPPLHFNCRSVLVPVTEIDTPFNVSSQKEIEGIKTLMPADFGGNVDR